MPTNIITQQRIAAMENILDFHAQKLAELEIILTALTERADDFELLMDYYYSDQRHQDIADDHAGKLPGDLKRGVLSEDLVYDVIRNYYSVSVQMLELATRYFKRD